MNYKTFDEYQKQALSTAIDRNNHNTIFHRVLGLVGETGEVAEKFKKIVRDHDSDFSKLDHKDMTKELGDILWYVAVLSDSLDIKLSDIVELNVEKLKDRQKRNKLSGSGDNR